ncbi:MAG TPA: SCO family protein [Rhizomicrobium sp.]|nr:SCO family protein [Rhizomicrobium sp.]
MFKTKEALLVFLLLVAAGLGAFLWFEGDRVPRMGQTLVSGQIAVGGPYALTDQDGKPRASTDFAGKYQLIYFGYTFCPDVCPTTLALMGAALDRLGPTQDRIVPVFITIDPERDTPEVLKKYVAAFGPRFVGLTGTPDEIAKVEKEYRVYAKKGPVENGTYAMDHSSVIYLMGPDGKLASFYDEATTPEDLAQKIKAKL